LEATAKIKAFSVYPKNSLQISSRKYYFSKKILS